MFEKVLVKKPKRARFDFSHGNTLSMQFGKLTPTEIRFIVPGDDVSVSMEQIVRVAPLPVPTFVNMKVRHDWFFVPLSMMYSQQALDQLLGQSPAALNRPRVATLTDYVQVFTDMPTQYGNFGAQEPFVAGSIHDYFNLPVFTDLNNTSSLGTNADWSAFQMTPSAANYGALLQNSQIKQVTDSLPGPILEPFLAYHYIWRDWYRFTGLSDNVNTPGSGSTLPWLENHVFLTTALNVAVTSTYSTWNGFNVGSGYYHGPNTLNSYFGIAYDAYLKRIPLLLPVMARSLRFLFLRVPPVPFRICVLPPLFRSLSTLLRLPVNVTGIRLKLYGMRLLPE